MSDMYSKTRFFKMRVALFCASFFSFYLTFSNEAFSDSSLVKAETENLEGIEAELSKKAWIAKAAKALHNGVPPSPTEVTRLAGLNEHEILDELFSDPVFQYTSMDFLSYFFDFQLHEYFVQGSLNYQLFEEKAQIWTAIDELGKNGDFFRFLDLNFSNTYVMQPNRPTKAETDYAHLENFDTSNFSSMSDTEIRRVGFNWIQSFYSKNKKIGLEEGVVALCSKLAYFELFVTSASVLGNIGFRFDFYAPNLQYDLQSYEQIICKSPAEISDFQIAAFFDNLIAVLDRARVWIEKTAIQEKEGERSEFAELKPSDIVRMQIIPDSVYGEVWTRNRNPLTAFSGHFGLANENSSTNKNRKRAARVFRNYFCDELTPTEIPLDEGENHDGDRHASDPACQACHYKLDPMAGFFKDYGHQMRNYSNLNPELRTELELTWQVPAGVEFFVFSDETVIQGQAVQDYKNDWKNTSPDQQNEWNIGLIRSTTNKELNEYGESLSDLFEIIKRSDEVKNCVVQRMAEFYVGKNITFDSEWLSSLSKQLDLENEDWRKNSSKAYKDIVKTLVTSASFKHKSPESGVCYDRMSQISVPCKVSGITEKWCVSCHNQQQSSGGLSLDKWIEEKGFFSHVDQDGNQLEIEESRNRMIERLTTDDEARVMPPKIIAMPISEKDKLLDWLTEVQK